MKKYIWALALVIGAGVSSICAADPTPSPKCKNCDLISHPCYNLCDGKSGPKEECMARCNQLAKACQDKNAKAGCQ